MSSLAAKISVVLFFILVAGFFVLRNNGLGEVAYPQAVMTLQKDSFTATEPIVVTINLNESSEQAKSGFIRKAFAQGTGPFKASVIGPDRRTIVNVPISVKETGEGVYTASITPTADLNPGRQTLHLHLRDGLASRTIEQDFMWGVLAINTHKSIYSPGEEANLAMAVLDEGGRMVCNADISLTITDPRGEKTDLSGEEGTIIVNPDCEVYSVTVNPDYEATYKVGGVGEYQMKLTATTENGTYSIVDAFEVHERVAFDVERVAHTRIYPTEDYTVELKVNANQNFSGIIEESIPTFFSLVDEDPVYSVNREERYKKISWEVDLSEEEEVTLSYTYDAPDISPEFYTLGPLEFKQNDSVIFQEARLWQVASDAIAFRASSSNNGGDVASLTITKPTGTVQNDVLIAAITIAEGESITAPSGWTSIRSDHQSDGVDDLTVHIFWKAAGSSEPSSYQWTFGGDTDVVGGIAAYTRVNTVTQINVHAGGSTGSGTSVTAPSVTTTEANTMLLGFFTTKANTSFTAPGTMTERWDQAVPSGASDVWTTSSADEAISASGATGTRTATAAISGAWVGQSVALSSEPEPTPTPTPTPTLTPIPTPTTAPTGPIRFEGLRMEGLKID